VQQAITKERRIFPNSLRRFILSFEQPDQSLTNSLVSFAGICAIRQVLEMLSTGERMAVIRFIHYPLWYATTAACVVLLVSAFSGESPLRVAKSVLACYLLILLAPVLDLLISGGRQVPMRYLEGSLLQLFISFVTFLGGPGRSAATPGMRIEIALMFAFAFVYLREKTRRPLRSLLCCVSIYASIFLFAILPALLSVIFAPLSRTGIPPGMVPSERTILCTLAILAFVFLLLILSRAQRAALAAIIHDVGILKALHYVLVFALGMVLWRRYASARMLLDHEYLDIPLAALSFLLGAVFSAVMNNVSDVDIDVVSNRDRALVAGSITSEKYRRFGWMAAIGSLLLAAAAGWPSLLFICFILGSYYLYSCPPFRLKRIPVISKLVIGANSIAACMMGYALFGGDPLRVPSGYMWFFLVAFSLAAQLVDLKDIEGDKAGGIMTLPVLIGFDASRVLIALFIVGCHVAAFVILGVPVFAIPVGASCILFLIFLFRRAYSERPLVVLDLVAMTGLIAANLIGWAMR
jgi:4-hydroxybenzoate polyprenyltransferase